LLIPESRQGEFQQVRFHFLLFAAAKMHIHR
jgi:hypothetical protein